MASTLKTEAGAGRPLRLFGCTVLPDWVDYNGHMRDASYGMVFSLATDALMDHIGLDALGRARHGGTLYTLESHVSYLQELHDGAALEVRTQLIAHDAKRLHVHHAMWASGMDAPAAIGEQMLLHVSTRSDGGPRAAAMPEAVIEAVERIARSHAQLPLPMHVGRSIGLRRPARPAAP